MFFTAGVDVSYFEPFSRRLSVLNLRDRIDFYCFLERDSRANPADSE